MAAEKCKLLEISLAKIEKSKSSRKCFGKSSVLHRNLMVNSVLNKVRTSEKSYNSDIFLNYREPRSIEMDIEEQEIEKINTRQRQNQQSSPFSSIKSNCKQQSPVPSIQSSLTRPTTPIPPNVLKDLQENCIAPAQQKHCASPPSNNAQDLISCHSPEKSSALTPKKSQKRVRSAIENTEDVISSSPKKSKHQLSPVTTTTTSCTSKPNNTACQNHLDVSSSHSSVPEVTAYSVSSLASLFNGLVAHSEAENTSLNFGSNYVTAMLAC